MDWMSIYTSREGRISRKTWWLGSLAMVVVVIILEFIVAAMLGVSMMPNMAALSDPNSADAATVAAQLSDSMRKSAWISLVFFVILFVPIMALGMKRRHDRNSNGRDLIIYLALTVILLLIQALGIGAGTTMVGTVAIPSPGPIFTGLSFIVGIYAIYLLVVMGFLKGTAGPNDYGPDPLGGTAAVAA